MRFLMTQSLLSSWKYQWSDFERYGEKAEEFQEKAERDFLSVLRREPAPTNEAIQKGIVLGAETMKINIMKRREKLPVKLKADSFSLRRQKT